MRLAVLYICTGRYTIFFRDFVKSCEKYFLPGVEKVFFVWTDDRTLGEGLSQIRIQYRPCGGFPADTLFRFEMFLQVKAELESFDYIYFFNANALFLQPVGEEILPDTTGLAMGRWPGRRLRQHPMFYPYERNKQSTAYIPPRKPPYVYYMGGLNGGTSAAYLDMVQTLSENIRKDWDHGIVAYVHDESHINRYLRDHPCKILGLEFSTPEELTQKSSIDYEPKIIFRDKVLLDPYFNKGRDQTTIGRIKKAFNVMKRAVEWYL